MLRKLSVISVIAVLLLSACSSTEEAVVFTSRNPPPADFQRGRLSELPEPDFAKTAWLDLIGYDLSSLDLDDRASDLMFADFNSNTKWPDNLPEPFDPDYIMELGKNPGLNIRSLHQEGVTGKGIGIGIIDQALLCSHVEYCDRLELYEELHWPEGTHANMHGPAVASIALGKSIGVAPEANLYYIAEWHVDPTFYGSRYNFTWLAESINRLLEINKTLPQENRIRVISISSGWGPNRKGYKALTNAVNEAKQQGVFVISSKLRDTYGFRFQGLGRDPLADPDDNNSYTRGGFWQSQQISTERSQIETLLIPMDSRCTASPTGDEDYVFYRSGSWSWSIPYIAGLYALACQVKPDITPKVFWETALNTGDSAEFIGGDSWKVVNPVKLMKKLQSIRY